MNRSRLRLVAWVVSVVTVWAIAVVLASGAILMGNLLLDAVSMYRDGWPEITFIFEGETHSSDGVRLTRYRIDYYSRDEWLMETIVGGPRS